MNALPTKETTSLTDTAVLALHELCTILEKFPSTEGRVAVKVDVEWFEQMEVAAQKAMNAALDCWREEKQRTTNG